MSVGRPPAVTRRLTAAPAGAGGQRQPMAPTHRFHLLAKVSKTVWCGDGYQSALPQVTAGQGQDA